jgi:hypothetical protein
VYWIAVIVGFVAFWCGFALAAALSVGKHADEITEQREKRLIRDAA